MALHEQCVGATDEWYTPPHVFEALGCDFDMDVASPAGFKTWVPTSRFLWSDSLKIDWEGFVWMNPPFGGRNALVPWLEKFFTHGNGIALTPDRTSAPWWQKYAPLAVSILFVTPKIQFIGADGKPGKSPSARHLPDGGGAEGECSAETRARRGARGSDDPGRSSSARG